MSAKTAGIDVPVQSPKTRLKALRETYLEEQRSRGHAEGVAWAKDIADYGELKRLAENWQAVETCETNDAYGAPGVFLNMIAEDPSDADRQSVNDFWMNLGSDSEEDKYSALFWDGFVVGALTVYASIDDE